MRGQCPSRPRWPPGAVVVVVGRPESYGMVRGPFARVSCDGGKGEEFLFLPRSRCLRRRDCFAVPEVRKHSSSCVPEASTVYYGGSEGHGVSRNAEFSTLRLISRGTSTSGISKSISKSISSRRRLTYQLSCRSYEGWALAELRNRLR